MLEKFVKGYAEENHFSGTVLVQAGGKELYHVSFGLANRQFGVPNANDTKYRIASISKVFTAVLILQLVDQGKIELHRTIDAYLPDYQGAGAGKVTIHHLLRHTSGIANCETISSTTDDPQIGKESCEVYRRPFTTDAILTRYCSGDLVNEPGKVFDYNNGEYVLLGKILEKAYGKSYEQVLKEQLLDPLSLNDSGFLHHCDIVEGLASTYRTDEGDGKLVNDRPVYIENWYAAGAMYSTTTDLLIFCDALFGSTLLSDRSRQLIFQPGLDNYGYGVWVRDVGINGQVHKTVQRYGRIMGANTVVWRLVDLDATIVILGNTDTTDMGSFAYQISRQLTQ